MGYGPSRLGVGPSCPRRSRPSPATGNGGPLHRIGACIVCHIFGAGARGCKGPGPLIGPGGGLDEGISPLIAGPTSPQALQVSLPAPRACHCCMRPCACWAFWCCLAAVLFPVALPAPPPHPLHDLDLAPSALAGTMLSSQAYQQAGIAGLMNGKRPAAPATPTFIPAAQCVVHGAWDIGGSPLGRCGMTSNAVTRPAAGLATGFQLGPWGDAVAYFQRAALLLYLAGHGPPRPPSPQAKKGDSHADPGLTLPPPLATTPAGRATPGPLWPIWLRAVPPARCPRRLWPPLSA